MLFANKIPKFWFFFLFAQDDEGKLSGIKTNTFPWTEERNVVTCEGGMDTRRKETQENGERKPSSVV